MEQIRPMNNWLGSSLKRIQGWTINWESYTRALEQGPLFPSLHCPSRDFYLGNGKVWTNIRSRDANRGARDCELLLAPTPLLSLSTFLDKIIALSSMCKTSNLFAGGYCIKIGFSGALILSAYFQDNRIWFPEDLFSYWLNHWFAELEGGPFQKSVCAQKLKEPWRKVKQGRRSHYHHLVRSISDAIPADHKGQMWKAWVVSEAACHSLPFRTLKGSNKTSFCEWRKRRAPYWRNCCDLESTVQEESRNICLILYILNCVNPPPATRRSLEAWFTQFWPRD